MYKHYQRAYLQKLADDTQQVTDFVQSHTAPLALAEQRGAILRTGAGLQRTLQKTAALAHADQLEQAHEQLVLFQSALSQLEDK